MHHLSPRVRPLLLASLAFLAVACSSSNHLEDYNFDETTAAVVAAIPPRPAIFSDNAFWIDRDRPWATALRLGTAIYKEREAYRAGKRMDEALDQIDVAERIARQSLLQTSRYLGYRPVNNPRRADYILDIKVHDYGLTADSWDGAVHFFLDADVYLIDPTEDRVIWKYDVHEHEPVEHGIFGIGGSGGNVLSARALSTLSTEEMAEGFARLADFSADQITRVLREDYYDSRN